MNNGGTTIAFTSDSITFTVPRKITETIAKKIQTNKGLPPESNGFHHFKASLDKTTWNCNYVRENANVGS